MMGIGIDYALSSRIVLGVEYDWSFFSLTRARSLETLPMEAPTSK
jgi:opacity protein-like surface antigen